MPGDMTLAEFERELRAVLKSAVEAPIRDAVAQGATTLRLDFNAINPLILRLLAAERERCKEACNAEIKDAQEAQTSRQHILGAMYCRKRIEGLGDPT